MHTLHLLLLRAAAALRLIRGTPLAVRKIRIGADRNFAASSLPRRMLVLAFVLTPSLVWGTETIVLQPALSPPTAPVQSELIRPVSDGWLGAPWELTPGFYVGAEYLFVRPTIENNDALIFAQESGDNIRGDFLNYDFDFQSSPRAFIGYRFDNAASLQFTYWHYDNNSSPSATITESGQFLVVANGDGEDGGIAGNVGDTVTSDLNLEFNLYDVDFLRPLLSSSGGWLFTPSLGARILDLNVNSTTELIGDNDFRADRTLDTQFVGAGPRIGIEGRRYFGGTRSFSLFMRADGSIMIGQQNADYQWSGGDSQNEPERVYLKDEQITNVTIAGFEVGGSWRVFNNLNLSAGYLFQVWFCPTSSFGPLPIAQQPGDLSFDGLFARAAWVF